MTYSQADFEHAIDRCKAFHMARSSFELLTLAQEQMRQDRQQLLAKPMNPKVAQDRLDLDIQLVKLDQQIQAMAMAIDVMEEHARELFIPGYEAQFRAFLANSSAPAPSLD